MDARTALLTVLDQVDYTAGACRVNEMVGAVLPNEVITLAREALKTPPAASKISWNIGNTPPEYGYYLATWQRGGAYIVSELWYNPTNGWFESRGYMPSHKFQHQIDQSIKGIIAWAPMPEPYREDPDHV